MQEIKLVLDANVLFSILINQGKNTEIFSNFRLSLYCPSFIFREFQKHRKEILSKTKRTEEEFNHLLLSLRSILKVIPESDFCKFNELACRVSPDINDASYLALALKLNCGIWSNDKKLKEQDFVKVYSTSDLINLLMRDSD